MVLFTEVISKMVPDMDLEHRFGLTVQSTKVSGASTKQTAKENFGMPTEMSTKVCGKTIKLMAMEFMCM